MDLATILGLVAGFALIGLGIISGGAVSDFVSVPSLLVTLGGALAATVVTLPPECMRSIIPVLRIAFRNPGEDPRRLVELLVGHADRARREGLLALETEAAAETDPFLHKALVMCAAGAGEHQMRAILETDLANVAERHRAGAAIFETMGAYAPSFGLIGAVIGLVQMLRRMEGGSVGPMMSAALVTFLYGLLLANLVFLPIAGKLKARHAREILAKEMVIEGVVAIHAGDTPGLVEEKLSSYLAPSLRREHGRSASDHDEVGEG